MRAGLTTASLRPLPFLAQCSDMRCPPCERVMRDAGDTSMSGNKVANSRSAIQVAEVGKKCIPSPGRCVFRKAPHPSVPGCGSVDVVRGSVDLSFPDAWMKDGAHAFRLPHPPGPCRALDGSIEGATNCRQPHASRAFCSPRYPSSAEKAAADWRTSFDFSCSDWSESRHIGAEMPIAPATRPRKS